MLQRSSSDVKLGGMRHTGSDEVLTRQNQGKGKKEILASLRRSFRKKNKSPVFQNCDDDFTSFSSQSASSTPQVSRKRTNSYVVPDPGSNSLSSTSYLSNGMSDSDTGNSAPHSPPSVRVSKGRLASEGGGGGGGEDILGPDKASPEHEDSKMVRTAVV